MMKIAKFTFNPFQENTYVLYDETKECAIVDPGCQTKQEQAQLADFIEKEGLTPVQLLNTHCHVDHVLGNNFVQKTYDLEIVAHKADLPTLAFVPQACALYGIKDYELSPEPTLFVEDGDHVEFGNTTLKVLFCPGHAPGHVVFYAEKDGVVVNGDVLFKGSYGRYDLPGGDFTALKKSITEKLFTLPDQTVVLCGHGPETTIGEEKQTNPILR